MMKNFAKWVQQPWPCYVVVSLIGLTIPTVKFSNVWRYWGYSNCNNFIQRIAGTWAYGYFREKLSH